MLSRENGICDQSIAFHLLDVSNPDNITCLAGFVKSSFRKLDILNVSNEWAKGVLSDVENLTEEKIDQVVNEYLKEYREGSLQVKGWPTEMSGYKAAVIALTRVLAKRNKAFIRQHRYYFQHWDFERTRRCCESCETGFAP